MTNIAVIGIGAGDEGKGKTTDYLCSQLERPLVIRFSGGHQAGHTVIHQLARHVFSSFGSGTLQGVPTYWSKYCTVHPIRLLNEYDVLKELGVTPILYVDEKCPITTPFDVTENIRCSRITKHGTCGMGIGTTFQREENHYSLLAEDLINPTILRIKLDLIRQYYQSTEIDLEQFLQACKDTLEVVQITSKKIFASYNNYVFEGSQGLLLDQNHGFFPHVTRSNTGLKNVIELLGANEYIETYYVTRAYQTRHGNGPMTNENLIHNIKNNFYETNKENPNQGPFRTALLDLNLLRYGLEKELGRDYKSIKNLVVTCLDLVENEYRFTENGQIVYCANKEEFLLRIKNFLRAEFLYTSNTPCSELTEFKI